MNKLSFSEITDLLASDNNQLMDRFINFRLSKDPYVRASDDIIINTPVTGLKPDITLSGTLQYGEKITSITLSIVNIDADFDFNEYGYITITAGYMSSGFSKSFSGQIINIYMAKPNPNGELVVTMTNADIVDLNYSKKYMLTYKSNAVTYRQLLEPLKPLLVDTEIEIMNVPLEWESKYIQVSNATYTFYTLLEVIQWINNKFLAVKELKPIVLRCVSSVDKGNHLVLSGMYGVSDITPVLKTLSCISSAYMVGDYATVTAPWNPEIDPGEVISINPKYFRTRVNLYAFSPEAAKERSGIWRVTNIQFTFSTRTTNTMTMQLTNVNNQNLIQ